MTAIPGSGVPIGRDILGVTRITASQLDYVDTSPQIDAGNIQQAIDNLKGGSSSDFFVNPLTGNDNNSGTLAKPLKTMQEALRREPIGQKSNVQIFPAAGVYDMTTDLHNDLGVIFLGGNRPQGPDSSPLVIVAPYTNEIGVRSTTATDPSEMTLKASGAALTPGALFGAFLSITSGPNVGQRCMVADNGVHVITVNAALLPGTCVNGTKFIIERPAAKFLYNSLFLPMGTLLVMKGIKFEAKDPTIPNTLFMGQFQDVRMSGCEIVLAGDTWSIDAFSRVLTGPFPGFTNPEVLSPLHEAAGVYVHSDPRVPGFPGIIQLFEHSSLLGPIMTKEIVGFANQLSYVELDDPVMVDSSFEVANQAQLNVFGFNPVPSPIKGSVFPGAPTFMAMGQSLITADNIDISGSQGDAIICKHGAQPNLGLVSGSGNAGVGVRVQQNSQGTTDSQDLGTYITNVPGSGPTTVTGALGDVSIGGVVHTYADVNAAGVNGLIVGLNALVQDSL